MQFRMIYAHAFLTPGTHHHGETVFPAVETALELCPEFKEALRYVASPVFNDYRNLIDLLLGETIQETRRQILRFYRDEGPRILEIYDWEAIHRWEHHLLSALHIAYQTHQVGGARRVRERHRQFKKVVHNLRVAK